MQFILSGYILYIRLGKGDKLKKAVWVTVEEYRKRNGLNSRQTANNWIKRKGLKTKKEERIVKQKQTITLVRIEE